MGQQTEEKMKDHHEDHEEDENEHPKQGQKKKSEMDKMKDYLHEDEALEEDGQTYARLM